MKHLLTFIFIAFFAINSNSQVQVHDWKLGMELSTQFLNIKPTHHVLISPELSFYKNRNMISFGPLVQGSYYPG